MQELENILEEINEYISEWEADPNDKYASGFIKGLKKSEKIIRKHMNDGWIPVEVRSPAGYERIGYDKQGNKYMRRLEIAYMTDTIEYAYGYYDGYKWMDKRYDIIENVLAWKIHEPYLPERSKEE